MADQRYEGSVKGLRETFGFIRPDVGNQDLFFLPMAMDQSCGVKFSDLAIGQRVSYKTIDHPKGLRAIEVLPL